MHILLVAFTSNMQYVNEIASFEGVKDNFIAGSEARGEGNGTTQHGVRGVATAHRFTTAAA